MSWNSRELNLYELEIIRIEIIWVESHKKSSEPYMRLRTKAFI